MIRVDKKKIKEIEDLIREEEEGQWELDDHIYRSYHHSYKITYIRFNALKYLYLTLYLIGKVKKVNWHSWSWELMVKECKKYIIAPKKGDSWGTSLTYTIFNEMINNDLPKVKGWIPTTPHVVPYLGYFCFFKGILKCILRWIKSGKTPRGFIETWEGVSTYFIDDMKWTKKELDEMGRYTKSMIKKEEQCLKSDLKESTAAVKGHKRSYSMTSCKK